MIKKREIDIFGVLLGVVIGCVLGFFLSTRIDISGTNNNNDDPVISQYGYVHLLQINRYSSPTDASNCMETLRQKDLFAICVYQNNYYYIYGGISNTSSGLDVKNSLFESKGYSPIVKKEYILDKANSVLDSAEDYEFWDESINNFVKSLEGKPIAISSKFQIDPVNLDMFSCLTLLQTLGNEELINKVRLQTYQIMIDNLG